LNTPEVNNRLGAMGYIVMGGGPAELAAYVKTEIAKYSKIIGQIGLPPQ
jgi:tripartite-type tricarboxylate transporter receptor subunit TctC